MPSGEPATVPASAHARGLALAAAVFAALNLAVAAAETPLMWVVSHDDQYTAAHLVDYTNAPRPDVVFLGSSAALSGFDPRLTSEEIGRASGAPVSSLNLAVAQGDVRIGHLIVKNVLRPEKQPRVLVYGLSEFELLPDDRPERALAGLPYTDLLLRLDDLGVYGGDTLPGRARFVARRVLPLWRDAVLVREAMSIGLNALDPRHRRFAEGPPRRPDGFRPFPEGVISPGALEATARAWRAAFHHDRIDGFRAQRLQDLLAVAERRGMGMVVVLLPSHSGHRALWSPGLKAGFRDLIQRTAAAHGATVIDLSEPGAGAFGDADFYDTVHFNPAGAARLTRHVAREALAAHFPAGARPVS
jgi:hypothetical protein